MRCFVMLHNPEKLDELKKGLRGRRYDYTYLTSTAEMETLIARGAYRDEGALVIIDTYFQTKTPADGGPTQLTPGHASMRLMSLIRQKRKRWAILALANEGSTNDGALAMEGEKAHNYHSMAVSKWFGRVFQNAINATFDMMAAAKPRVRQTA